MDVLGACDTNAHRLVRAVLRVHICAWLGPIARVDARPRDALVGEDGSWVLVVNIAKIQILIITRVALVAEDRVTAAASQKEIPRARARVQALSSEPNCVGTFIVWTMGRFGGATRWRRDLTCGSYRGLRGPGNLSMAFAKNRRLCRSPPLPGRTAP